MPDQTTFDNAEYPQRITRREVLKRGAVIGGSVLWVAPLVQTVGMGKAYAATPSPTCSVFCVVWAPATGISLGGWKPYTGGGCLPCPPGSEIGLPPDIGDFTVDYNVPTLTYTVAYPDTYELLPSGDPTPDDLVNGSAAIRAGSNVASGQFVLASQQMPGLAPNTTQIQFTNWTVGDDRIELILKHCV